MSRLLRLLIRFLGLVFTLATAAGLVAVGAWLTVRTKWDLYVLVDEAWKSFIAGLPELPAGIAYRQILAVLIILAGFTVFFGLVLRLASGDKRRKNRSISYVGNHGEVTIELEHVEGTLVKVADEVKKMSIRLEPTDKRSRVLVTAECVLEKDPDTEARTVTDRVQQYLQIHSRKILGVQDVDVELRVRQFRLKLRNLKPMPLLLEGPRPETASANPGAGEPDADQHVHDEDAEPARPS